MILTSHSSTKVMTPQQHKARGVLMVTQAFTMRRENQSFAAVQAKLEEARARFAPENGNDDQLWTLCTKHMDAMDSMRKLRGTIDTKFFDAKHGVWNLQGLFLDPLRFETDLEEFFAKCDSFLLEEAQDIVSLVRQMTRGTRYEARFEGLCAPVQARLGF